MKTNNQAKPKASEVHYWLYSTGNFANNIIFMMVGTYITYFYTNILGISPAMAGLVFMVARLVDAFTDPLMGIIVDKTNTKIGKYRPWIIAGAPFLLLLCTVGPIIAYVFSIAAMYFYPLTRKGEVEMQEKLDKMSFVNLEDDLIL